MNRETEAAYSSGRGGAYLSERAINDSETRESAAWQASEAMVGLARTHEQIGNKMLAARCYDRAADKRAAVVGEHHWLVAELRQRALSLRMPSPKPAPRMRFR